jgi:hypothetical protein
MATSTPVTAAELRAALRPVLDWLDAPDPHSTPAVPDRTALAAAVRLTVRAFAQAHPGKAVEVRVPPFAAAQCLPGGTHTRGTPPHVVEAEPLAWLRLVTGRTTWATELAAARLHASGHRADEVRLQLPMQVATESNRINPQFE